ncbi:MAG: hypothetical protein FWC08_12980 [Defluviitaleaceae bacterium]|nr:hypothetical protein [Defluviitaleaceae bacterium]
MQRKQQKHEIIEITADMKVLLEIERLSGEMRGRVSLVKSYAAKRKKTRY